MAERDRAVMGSLDGRARLVGGARVGNVPRRPLSGPPVPACLSGEIEQEPSSVRVELQQALCGIRDCHRPADRADVPVEGIQNVFALDPAGEVPVGLQIRELNNGAGVDVAIEVSGSNRGLQGAREAAGLGARWWRPGSTRAGPPTSASVRSFTTTGCPSSHRSAPGAHPPARAAVGPAPGDGNGDPAALHRPGVSGGAGSAVGPLRPGRPPTAGSTSAPGHGQVASATETGLHRRSRVSSFPCTRRRGPGGTSGKPRRTTLSLGSLTVGHAEFCG
jgi:hypothetical protein